MSSRATGRTVSPSWVCCQLGAREHYAVPRALARAGRLSALVTEAWVTPGSAAARLPRRGLGERYHPELEGATVRSFTAASVGFELAQKARGTTGWRRVIARNRWFQRRAVRALEALRGGSEAPAGPPVLFAYSYAALEIARYAKSRGWKFVLGQIDPGPYEEQLVGREHARRPQFASAFEQAPAGYWRDWREECELADRVLVNSRWSKQALESEGVAAAKVDVVPLAYEPAEASGAVARQFPAEFTAERPLRVLFLGQLIVRKGVAAVLEAARLLRDLPVEFWMVGPVGIPESAMNGGGKVRWVGPVSRRETAGYYSRADLFLFPTLSDGFGLTQLEAQSWGLPIVASRFCGDVVSHGESGLVLEEVSGESVAEALRRCLERPAELSRFSARASESAAGWDVSSLQQRLVSLAL
ncbi:MAG TPA: glycosyltransferase family 4 protein [Pyrinomonadaceae bacterium]|nr:glycosyltransferase family 4 protein [Pyrinomonadaceae bacterium]